MTHFASAANYSSTQTEDQIQAFERVRGELGQLGIQPRYVHLSSTTPIAYGRREAWGRMVRPGHAIYGYISTVARGTAPPRLLAVRPALTWKAAVLAVKDLPQGALVGYGGMFRAPAPDAHRGAGGWLCRRHSAPAVEQGPGDRGGQSCAHPRRGVDGSDDHRCDAGAGASSRGTR